MGRGKDGAFFCKKRVKNKIFFLVAVVVYVMF